EIRYNYHAGINIDLNGEPKIIGCAITANDYAGIKCDYGAKPVISECIISENSHGIIAFKQAEPNLGTVDRRGNAVGGNNRIFENWEYNIYNHTSSTIYAQNNNWLTNNFSEIENTIYDKADDAKYGSVIYKPLFTEMVETIPIVAQVTPAEQKPEQEAETRPEEDRLTTTPQAVAENKVVPQETVTAQPEVKREEVKQKPPEKIEEKKEKAETDVVVKPTIQEKIDTKKEVQKELTAEEKIFAEIFSLRKPALEYQLDNKPVKRVKAVPPEYPPSYKSSRRPGIVFVRVVVDISGKVETANILKVEGGEEFAKASLEAVKKFEYAVGILRGKTVRYVKNERFEFKP
ncbi:MAG: TonB family protein, partial [Calditrichia bacterium]|nr:TonB family protein [Calditrichia bacterium]